MSPVDRDTEPPPGLGQLAMGSVIAIVVLAGCLGSPGPDTRSNEVDGGIGADGTVLDHRAGRFSWNLSDGGEGELVLAEVAPVEAGTVRVEMTGSFPVQDPPSGAPGSSAATDRPNPCLGLWTQGKGGPTFLGPKRYGATARMDPAEADARTPWPAGESVEADRRQTVENVTAGASLPVLFGVDEADRWRSTGADLTVTIEGDGDLGWRIVDRRPVTCESRLAGWAAGDVVRTCCVGGPADRRAVVTVADGLAEQVDLASTGFLWVEVGANREYHLRVEGPNGTVLERHRPDLDSLAGTALRVACAEPGTWDLSVSRLVGTGDAWASFTYAEIPAWMQTIPGEPPGRTVTRSSSDGDAQLVSINRC